MVVRVSKDLCEAQWLFFRDPLKTYWCILKVAIKRSADVIRKMVVNPRKDAVIKIIL